jgi:NO-binding membrane sensor protein with MHYT domain
MFNRWFLTDDVPLSLCIPFGHDPWLVALSYIVASFAAFTAFHLMARVRSSADPVRWAIWLATAGLAMGVGIWAMHFIAILAVEISVPMEFDVALTVLSAAFAAIASAVAFGLAARNGLRLTSLLLAGTVLGGGIGLMHYTGMVALRMPV